MVTLDDAFAHAGPLAERIGGYRPRPQQRAMAEAVSNALRERHTLLCEAGTGTGKTLAYLVPVLLAGGSAIISTATRQLQDQIWDHELPLLRSAFGLSTRAALLKGRANYLCRHRLALAETDSGNLSRDSIAALVRIREWAQRTRRGDIAELAEIEEGAPVWRVVTSTSENCLGQACPVYQDCHVVRARQEAARANVVIVNHHLFLADLTLKRDALGELLPASDAVVLDEAHQLPDLATRFLGTRLSSAQLDEIARDSVQAQAAEAPDTPVLGQIAARLITATRGLGARLGGDSERSTWRSASRAPGVGAATTTLAAALAELGEALATLAERGATLQSCQGRCAELGERLATLCSDADDDQVRWVERRTRGFVLHASPIDAGAEFAATLAARPSAWILTSATLAVDGSIDHLAARLGIPDCEQRVFGSPFNFAEQGLCYLPPGLPDPGAPGYRRALIEAALPVLDASGGRAFLLFTSHRALHDARSLLAERSDFPLLTQGEAPRSELLRRFRVTPRAVLLGTYSFWEGVDVRGPALSCVLIDKLPFAPPNDPVLEARCERAQSEGRNPFHAIQIPRAVIKLKQGVGRLIRDATDRGVVVLCDPRLRTRSYGKIFLRSLPPIPLCQDIDSVRRFFATVAEEKAPDRTSPECAY